MYGPALASQTVWLSGGSSVVVPLAPIGRFVYSSFHPKHTLSVLAAIEEAEHFRRYRRGTWHTHCMMREPVVFRHVHPIDCCVCSSSDTGQGQVK
jgi:hypothetical protein